MTAGALGVVDVEIPPRRWPPLSLLLRGPSSISSTINNDSSSLRIARRWGLALEAAADGTGAVEVAWSKAAGVRAGDVLLAVDGVPVAGRGVGAVEKLLLLRLGEEGGGDRSSTSTSPSTTDSPSTNSSSSDRPLRLTLDTTKGWGVSSGARRRQQQGQRWRRFACRWVIDGYDSLLQTRSCPNAKLALHALALVLLYPLVESALSSARTLSLQHGPLLLLQHSRLLAWERLWATGFLCAALGLGLGLALRHPHARAVLVGGSALLIHYLLLSLLIIPTVVALTLVWSGFVLLPPAGYHYDDDDDGAGGGGGGGGWVSEDELRALLTHILVALLLPLLVSCYMRRLAAFCDGYAALLRAGRNPKLLGLTMPLSAHFISPEDEDRARFLSLRASGY